MATEDMAETADTDMDSEEAGDWMLLLMDMGAITPHPGYMQPHQLTSQLSQLSQLSHKLSYKLSDKIQAVTFSQLRRLTASRCLKMLSATCQSWQMIVKLRMSRYSTMVSASSLTSSTSSMKHIFSLTACASTERRKDNRENLDLIMVLLG